MIFKTILGSIDKTQNGIVRTSFILLGEENGEIISRKKHICAMPPGENIDNQVILENTNITSMGYPPISTTDIDAIRTECNNTWTPAVIAAYQTSLIRN